MSAQGLRAAAVLLREASANASMKPDPTAEDLEAIKALGIGAIFVDRTVALALADWLDSVHDAMVPDPGRTIAQVDEGHAFAVADAILGTTP